MADQTISVNFVAKNDQFLNPMAQMTKATKNFTDAGQIAKDVLKTVGFAALATGIALITPREEFTKLVSVIKVGAAQMAAYVTAGAAVVKKELSGMVSASLATSLAGSMENFAKKAALGVASLGFLDKAAIGVGLTIAGSLAVAAKSAADFDQSMRQVNTILQFSGKQYDQLNKNILDISANFPIAAKSVADGVYRIASAGFTSLKDVTLLTKESAIDAVAGLSDMATSAKTLVTVLNAYGLAAYDAAHVSDILFQTVKDGQLNFSELSQQLAGFIGVAKNSGATLEETMATYSLITNQVGDAAEAATDMAGVFRALITPTNDAAKVLRIMGFESGEAAIKQLGVVGTVKAMSSAVNDNVTALGNMFPNIRALNGILAITGTSNEKAASTLDDFTNKTKVNGAAQQAYQEQMKNVNTKLDQLKNASATVAIEIGRTFLPVMGQLVQFMGGFLGMLKDAPDWLKTALGIFAALASTLLVLGGTVLALRSSWNIMKTLMKAADFLGISDAAKTAAGSIDVMGKATALAGKAFTMMAQAATAALAVLAIATAAGQVYDAISHTNDKIKDLEGNLLGLAQGSKTAMDIMNNANFDPNTGWRGALDTLAKWHLAWGPVTDLIIGKTSKLDQQFDAVDKSLAQLVRSGNAQAATQALQQLAESADVQKALHVTSASAAMDALTKKFNDYGKAQKDAGIDAALSAAAQASMGDELAKIQAQFGGAAAGAVNLGNAEKFLQAETDAMNESQKALQSTLQGMAGTGTNADAINAVTSAHQAQAEASSKAEKAAAKETETVSQQVGNQLALERALQGVTTAQKALTDAQTKSFTMDLSAAERALAASYDDTKRAIFALEDATQALNDLRNPSARTVDEANIALQKSLLAQQQSVADLATAQDKLNLARDHANPDEVAQAQRELAQAQYAVTESGYAVVDAQKKYDDLTKDTPDRQKAIAKAQLDVNDATRNVADSTDNQTKSMKALSDIQQQIKDQPNVIKDAELSLKEAINGVTAATEALQKKQSGPEASAATATFDKNIDLQKTSLDELSKKLEESITANHEFWDNTFKVAQKYGPQVVNEIDKMGAQAPEIMKKMADASDTQGQRFANDLMSNAATGTKSFLQIMEDNLSKAPGQVHTYTKQAADALASELGIGVTQAEQILQGYGLQLQDTATSIVKEVGPGQFRLYTPGKGFSGPTFSAEGNIFEDHSPQISRGGTRVWSEPETGGEAYIPLGRNKRARSVGLLKQVAGIFGNDLNHFADGGVVTSDALKPPLTMEDFSAPGNKWNTAMKSMLQSREMYKQAIAQMSVQTQGGIAIVNKALTWLGVPYLWGGGRGSESSARQFGVDCSGLVIQVARALGIPNMEGNTGTQIHQGTPIPTVDQAQAGDLVFFGVSLAQGEPHHVGIYEGNGMMINAPHSGTVVRHDKLFAGIDGIRRIATTAQGGNPGAPGNGAAMGDGINSPAGFAQALQIALGDAPTAANTQSIIKWENHEGGQWHNAAHYNPLNTTQPMPGSQSMNSVGVQSYMSWADGLEATRKTILNGHYPNVVRDLRSGFGFGPDVDPDLVTWGTGAIFDSGGWLPPRSRTMAVNNTSYWEPVGPPGGAPGTVYHVPVKVDARVASNVDLDRASAIITREVERGVTVALQKVQQRVLARNGR